MAAARQVLPEARQQRCTVHLMRSAKPLDPAKRGLRSFVTAALQTTSIWRGCIGLDMSALDAHGTATAWTTSP